MVALLLYCAMALLLADAATEMGLIVTMVRWLHVRAGKGFEVSYQGESFILQGKPLHFLLDQGHTSNGAAGSAVVVVCIGGALALFLRHRQLKRYGGISGFTAFLYNFWLYFTAVSAIFTIAAFVYVFVETYTHTGQHINVEIASRLNNRPYPNQVPYPEQEWTPQNWYPAFLDLDIVDQADRNTISYHLRIMQGWQWNLIPMMILGVAVAFLAFADRMRHKQYVNRQNGVSRLEAAKMKHSSSSS
jgi:hypothetical protein